MTRSELKCRPPNMQYSRRYLIVALDFVIACVMAQLFLDQWLAAFMSEVRQSPNFLLLNFIPNRVQLSLILALGMLCVIAYRVTSGDRGWADRGIFILGSGAISGFVADKLKFVFGRPPPDAWVPDAVNGFNLLNGGVGFDCFPSSHAAMAAGIAGALSIVWPARRGVFLSLAVIIAASRLFQPHYLSDVFSGLAIGLIVVALVEILFFYGGIPLDPRNPRQNC